MRKLAVPTNVHYGYVSSILVSAFIEPRYMLLGGSGLFRLASELFKIVKLNFWSMIMENYASILEKKNETLNDVMSSPLLDRPDRHVGRGSGRKKKGRKKIDVRTQLRLPSRRMMTTRRPEWRCVAKTCGLDTAP